MKTIKIILNDDGSVLSLSCGFQLNQYSYNDTLLNVYVPGNILENQTDLENVDYSNNVVMGMYYTLANGSQKVGNPYYFTFVKDNVVIDNKLYTLYERKMPKEFTLYYGTQTYCINVVALKTTIENNVATNEVVGNITSNNFELNIVRATNMVDEGIEEDTDMSTLIANVNSLLANMLLKQDKSDSLIQVSIANGSNVKTSVVREALNVLNQRVAENFTNVTTNTGDITQLQQDVVDINNSMITGMRYCGSVTSPNAPTSALLDSQMSTWGLTKQNGDTIIWTETISGATDKSYTCRYGISGWTITDMPTVETASNTDAGLIQGNYGANDNTSNIIASIVGGKIVDIYYNRNGIYYELASNMDAVITAINGLVNNGSYTAIKSQYATYDNSEYGSVNPTPINQKYMTKSEGATKQFVTDYALPKTFNDIYRFDFTNNKLVSNSVNTSKTLPTQLGSVDFGSYTIEKSDVLTFELSNKNTFACNFYAMFDNNITDVTFTMVIKANNTPIASTTSETTDFTGGTYKKVSINGDFALLGDSEITIDDSVTLSVELSANITTSATNNLTIYSNTTLPSAFTLNVASSTIIINSSGVLGGVNYHTLNGVMTNNAVEFALPNDTTLVDATLHTFILDYSGITIGTNTTLYITNGNVRHNINLPTNYNSGATLSYGNVSQFLAPNSKIVFTAIYENGFFTIIGGNTLSSTQIQALLNAKQNVIDSSHKLDADLVSDTNSSNKFVSAYLKSLITTNRQDINLLDGRVTNLENNPTSNVSGTNDGTNWTSITIGNETYAIPSGSSSGGSGSGETLKLIRLSFVWVDEVYIGMRGTDFETFLSQLSQQMGTTITEDMIPTLWTNASDYEKLTVVYVLTLYKLFASWGANDVLAFKPTQVEVDGQTVVTSISLSYLNSSNQITTIDTLNDISSSTISITTIGGGNGGSSASSGAYYEIKTNNIAFYEENGTLVDSNTTNNFTITFGENEFEACLQERINPALTQMGMSTISNINEFITLMNQLCTETETSPSNKAYNLFAMISGYARMFIGNGLVEVFYDRLVYLYSVSEFYAIQLFDNDGDTIDQPFGISATWTLTEYGTSGGSSASESYYKIQIQDSGEVDNEAYTTILKLIVDKQDFNDLLTAFSQLIGSNLSTPQDVINAYDNTKGNSNYFYGWALAFISLASASLDRNYNALIWRADTFTSEKIVKVGDDTGIYCGEIGGTLLNATPTLKGQISFSSSSTLTITEQTNQKI